MGEVKSTHEIVAERSRGRCEICGSTYGVEHHHIIGGRGKRAQHETPESVIALCWDHHYGTRGSHGRDGKAFNDKLKLRLQETYQKQGRTEDEIRRLMGGKTYLTEEEKKCLNTRSEK